MPICRSSVWGNLPISHGLLDADADAHPQPQPVMVAVGACLWETRVSRDGRKCRLLPSTSYELKRGGSHSDMGGDDD